MCSAVKTAIKRGHGRDESIEADLRNMGGGDEHEIRMALSVICYQKKRVRKHGQEKKREVKAQRKI